MWALVCSETGGSLRPYCGSFGSFEIEWLLTEWKINECRVNERSNIHRKWCFNEGVDNRKGCPSDFLVLQRSILWRRGRMPSFLFAFAEANRRLYCDISISDVSHKLSTWAYCRSTFAKHRPPHSRHCTVSASNTTALFLKDVFFLCFSIMLTAFFQDTIVFLRVPSDVLLWLKWGFVHVRCGRRLCFGMWKGGWTITVRRAIKFELMHRHGLGLDDRYERGEIRFQVIVSFLDQDQVMVMWSRKGSIAVFVDNPCAISNASLACWWFALWIHVITVQMMIIITVVILRFCMYVHEGRAPWKWWDIQSSRYWRRNSIAQTWLP